MRGGNHGEDGRRRGHAVGGSPLARDDDGETFDFEKGAFSWTQLSIAKDTNGVWQGSVTPDANGRRGHSAEVKGRFRTAHGARSLAACS